MNDFMNERMNECFNVFTCSIYECKYVFMYCMYECLFAGVFICVYIKCVTRKRVLLELDSQTHAFWAEPFFLSFLAMSFSRLDKIKRKNRDCT